MVKLYQKFMNRKERYPGLICHDSRGFTLIEMIGVLAVVAVLAAMVLPKVFDVIAESRVNALAASVKAYETAVTKYYGDLGTLLPLSSAGLPAAETTGDSSTATSMAARLTLSRSDSLVTANGLWPKFRGPYLEKFGTATPPASTLIEMIGVLAVVAVLAAMVLPKVFDVIAESRVNALAASVKAYETAVTKYYGDLGTLLPLSSAGLPAAETTGDSSTATSMAARLTLSRSDSLVTANGLWPKFRGPYLEKFGTATPPALGTAMYIPARAADNYDTTVTATNLSWDLKGDDGKSDIPTGANVVYYRLTDLSLEDFDRFDSIVDRDIGTTADTKQKRGRAKYDTGNDTLYLYLAHR